MKREKTINAETDINQTGGMHLPSLSLPSQTVRCIYLIFEMFQVKRKDSFQSLAGLISPPAAREWNLELWALSELALLRSGYWLADKKFESETDI